MQKLVTIQNYEGETTYELASFGDRFGARIIDTLIIFIPSLFVPIISGWLYWAVQQSGANQATIGQKALNIMVIDVNGDKVTFGQASGRFFGNILSALFFMAGYIMFFFNDKNQCLHDNLSGCLVVKNIPVSSQNDIINHLVE